MTYDWLKQQRPSRASREYLEILHLAAKENETAVDCALQKLIEQDQPISAEAVKRILSSEQPQIPSTAQIVVAEVDLGAYDALLSIGEEVLPYCQPN